MIMLLSIWQALLVLLVLVLAVVLVALARQIGVLHERLAPLGNQEVKPGLDVGQIVPRLVLHTLDGKPFTVGDVLPPAAGNCCCLWRRNALCVNAFLPLRGRLPPSVGWIWCLWGMARNPSLPPCRRPGRKCRVCRL